MDYPKKLITNLNEVELIRTNVTNLKADYLFLPNENFPNLDIELEIFKDEKKLILNSIYNSELNKIPHLTKKTLDLVLDNFEINQVNIPTVYEPRTRNLCYDSRYFDGFKGNITEVDNYEKSPFLVSFYQLDFNKIEIESFLNIIGVDPFVSISVYKNNFGGKK